MSEFGQGACQPYEITAKCFVGDVEYAAEDVTCLNPQEHEFLFSQKCVKKEPTAKDVTRPRAEASGCGQCGASN